MSLEQRAKIVSVAMLTVVAVGIGIALLVYSAYTDLAVSDRDMVRAFKEMEAALTAQRDLVPDLVEVAREVTLIDYPQYDELAEWSGRIGTSSRLAEGVTVQNRFILALDRVISVADSYPQLRAGQEYASILEQFRDAEFRASIARNRFNEAAVAFNSKLETFPGNIVSGFFDVSYRPLLKQPREL